MYASLIGQQFMLMYDDVKLHVANILRYSLDDLEIKAIVWPAHSPDFNPIEYVWDNLKRLPDTLQDLQATLREEWELINQERIAELIYSMPQRIRDIRAHWNTFIRH